MCISSFKCPKSRFIYQLPSLYQCQMCNLQLKITMSKIELLISTASAQRPSTKPCFPRFCLSWENGTIIQPGDFGSFSSSPQSVHVKQLQIFPAWSNPLSSLSTTTLWSRQQFSVTQTCALAFSLHASAIDCCCFLNMFLSKRIRER